MANAYVSYNVSPNPNDSNVQVVNYGRVLNSGTSNTTISNSLVTANSVILVSWEYVSGSPSFIQVTTKTPGASFVVNTPSPPAAGAGYINYYIPFF